MLYKFLLSICAHVCMYSSNNNNNIIIHVLYVGQLHSFLVLYCSHGILWPQCQILVVKMKIPIVIVMRISECGKGRESLH